MKSRDIALSSIFGIVISLQKVLLPAPYDKIISVLVQIVLLSLAFLMMEFLGPIFTGFVSGLLTASLRGGLGLMTFSFAVLYGVVVSSFNRLFRVVDNGQIRSKRLMVSSLISTLCVGVLSAITSMIVGILPYNLFLVSVIIGSGAMQGFLGGYLSSLVWKKYIQKLAS